MNKNINALKQELEYEEGKEQGAYKDTEGFWTIGIGHRLNEQTDAELAILGLEDDLEDWEGFEITEAQIYQLVDHDIEETMRSLRNAFDAELLESLDPKRFMAAFQMCYQIGSVTGFPAFCEAVRNSDWDRAADEMLYRDGLKKAVWSRWHKQTPKRCEKMADLMRYGSVEQGFPSEPRILTAEALEPDRNPDLSDFSDADLIREIYVRLVKGL